MPLNPDDLQQLSDICNSICYHMTAHLSAVASGVPSDLPHQVGQIYQLATQLPKAQPAQWLTLTSAGAAAAAAAAAAAGPASGRKHHKWTPEMEAELIRLVEDEDFRSQALGKEGTRGGALNWAAVGRHFGYTAGAPLKVKYSELKGEPLPASTAKKEKKEEAADGEKAAKKAKTAAPTPAAAAPAPAAPAAADGPTPASGHQEHVKWSKKEEAELQKLVEDEDARKAAFGKKKLRWKKIAEHFDRKAKACRKHYSKLTGKDAPSDDE